MISVIDKHLQGSPHRRPGWYAVLIGCRNDVDLSNMDCALHCNPSSALDLDILLENVGLFSNLLTTVGSGKREGDIFSFSEFSSLRLALRLYCPIITLKTQQILRLYSARPSGTLVNIIKKHFKHNDSPRKSTLISPKVNPASTVMKFLKSITMDETSVGLGIGEVVQKGRYPEKVTAGIVFYSSQSIIDFINLTYINLNNETHVHIYSLSGEWDTELIINSVNVAQYVSSHLGILLILELAWMVTKWIEETMNSNSIASKLQKLIPELRTLFHCRLY